MSDALTPPLPPKSAVPQSVARARLERRLLKAVGQAVHDFEMIAEGDRILVGLSGGKDSYTLLALLQQLQRRAPISFEIEAVNLDPGYSGYQPQVVRGFAESQAVKIHMLEAPIEQLVAKHIRPGQAACPLCSRIRRGSFYTLARQIGATKLALGHHLDDVIETVLMNMFYAGALRGMPPRLEREEGPPTVIRPLCYALERDIASYAELRQFPLIPCASEHCAASDRRRQVVKRLLADLEQEHPDLKTQMRRALANVHGDALFDLALLGNRRSAPRLT
jgi:tRNA 2-thiocytidine biosynthesis protein TtcA